MTVVELLTEEVVSFRWSDRPSVAPPSPEPEELSRLVRRGFGMRRYQPRPLPRVAHQLLEMTSADTLDFADVSRVVAQDMTLVAEILRIVNTTGYARGAPIETIEQAVNRLGFEALRGVATQAAMKAASPRQPEYAEAVQRLHAHAVATAHLTRLVQQCAGVRVQDAFLAGFFHDLGFLASLMLISDVYGDAPPSIDAIWPELDRIHGRIGGLMAELWKIPEPIPTIASGHHVGPMTPLMAVVYVADSLATDAGAGAVDRVDARRVSDIDGSRLADAADVLELSDDKMDELFSTAPEAIEKALTG